MSTRTFEFQTLLTDSRAVVTVSCNIDQDGDIAEFNHVLYEGFDVFEVLSNDQWDGLTYDALMHYRKEQETQAGIDFENSV